MKLLAFIIVTLASTALAQYPEMIWDRSGDGEESKYGAYLFSLGDQNHDGFDDWGVIAYGEYPIGQPSEPLTHFFYGGDPPSTEPYMTWRGNPQTDHTGGTAFSVGDLNGDGYIDWARYVRRIDNPDSNNVELYYGGCDADMIPDIVFSLLYLESDMHGMGDFNGDGFDDLYIHYDPPLDYGEVILGGDPFDLNPDWRIHSEYPGSLDTSPKAFGDINGDGCDDLVSRSVYPNYTTYIYLGGSDPDTLPDYTWLDMNIYPASLSSDLNSDGYMDLVNGNNETIDIHLGGETVSSTPSLVLNMETPDGSVFEVNSAGDFNFDGYDDLVAVCDNCIMGWGKLALYLGHRWMDADPVLEIDGRDWPYFLVGIWKAQGIGDVNGDGVDDLAIGAWNTNNDGRRGRVIVLAGDTTMVVPAGNPNPFLPQRVAISIYPNPVNSMATVELQVGISGQPVELGVYSILGQLVERVTLNSAPLIRHQLNVTSWASGQYFIHVDVRNNHLTEKLIVLK